MAVSSFAGGSQRRRSRTNTNPYAQAAAQQNRQRFTRSNARKTYSNPYAQAAAQQQPAVDPLTNMLSQQQQMMMAQSGGSMGAQPSMADAQGGGGVSAPVNQQPSMADAQGTGASQPANMPPPPPPPPPAPPAPQPTMAEMQSGGSVIPQPTMAQNAANRALNDRLAAALRGGTGAQDEMARRQGMETIGVAPPTYTNPYEQAALLQRGGSTLSPQEEMAARQGGGGSSMTPQEEMAARQGTELPDLSGYRSPYEEAALAQGGDVTATPTPTGATDAQAEMFARQGGGLQTFASTGGTEEQLAMQEMQQRPLSGDPALESQLRAQLEMAARQGLTTTSADTGRYVNPYADAAAQQEDTGLRTFAASPEFNPNAAGLENLARRQDAGLQTFAAPGSRYNRGAEQLRRQAGQRLSGTLQDRLEQAYMGRIDAANDPILASQIADQQLRQQEAQQGLVEQLSRYGVLRGGGDTAAALTRMAEGNERNRLALEAAAAQRRQGDLRDASAFDQARSSIDIAQRGQSLEERLAADRLLDTALGRDVTRADVTGQFRDITSPTGYRDTLAAQRQRQQMEIERRAQDLREDLGAQDIATSRLGRDVTRAGQTGQFRDETSPTGFRDTLAAQELRQRMQIEEDIADQTIKDRKQARNIAAAGLTGQFQGSDTLQAQEQEQRMRLAMADATGLLNAGVANQAPIETLAGARQRRELDLAESAQDTRERLAAQDIATSALGRDVTRAGLTGQFRDATSPTGFSDTLQAQLQRQQMDLAEDANLRADAADRRAGIAQRAGLLGEIAGEGSAPARTTLAGRELALREDLARAEDRRAQQAAESALFGQIVTGAENQAPIVTLEGKRATSALDSAALAREATEAGLTGRFDGGMTADERDRDLARRISEAGVTGRFDTERRGVGTVDTIQSQAIESSLQNEALNRALGRAGATGLFREEGDPADPRKTLENRLRTAGLTGRLDDGITLAGREARQDLIGSILAASDPELQGRTDSLAAELTRQLGDEFALDSRRKEDDDNDDDDTPWWMKLGFPDPNGAGGGDDLTNALEIDTGQASTEQIGESLRGMTAQEKNEQAARLRRIGYSEQEIAEAIRFSNAEKIDIGLRFNPTGQFSQEELDAAVAPTDQQLMQLLGVDEAGLRELRGQAG